MEAFNWLDENMVDASEAPDEATDWIFMATPQDWTRLHDVWPVRPTAWREAFAYILNQAPIRQAQSILRIAIYDADADVASQAALSLCDQMREFPDEAPFDPVLVPRLREIRQMLGAGDHDNWGEIDWALQQSDIVPTNFPDI